MRKHIKEEKERSPNPAEQIGEYKVASPPALTITIQSWATPIIGLLMLIAGLLLGYAGRPYISDRLAEPVTFTPQAQIPVPTQSGGLSEDQQQELMDFVVEQTRHFQGSEDAPVTIVEFSDFQ